MSKATRIILSLVVSMALFTGMTMAQAGANNVEQAKAEKAKNDKGKEHHSSLAKAAFWRRHKDAGKNAKRAQTTQTLSKQAQAKTAQVKPVSAKQASGKKDQKQEQHVSNVSKPSTKTAPAAKKTKPLQAKDPKTASLKQ